MAACAQMGRFYDLPTGVAAGMADSKLRTPRPGYEKGYTTVLAGHSGANLVYESAGMLGSLLGACLESFVIDNDMLGAANRSVRGIDIDDESLSFESMREVCMEGPNHFLGIPRRWGSCSASTSIRRSATERAPRSGASRARPTLSSGLPRGCARRWPVTTRLTFRRSLMRACARSFASCWSRRPIGSSRALESA